MRFMLTTLLLRADKLIHSSQRMTAFGRTVTLAFGRNRKSLGHRLISAKWVPRVLPTSEAHHDTLPHRDCRRLQEVPDLRCLSREGHHW